MPDHTNDQSPITNHQLPMANHQSPITIGVLALQGDFAEHGKILSDLSVCSLEVRNRSDLSQCDALILPGGESTVIMKLLQESGLDRAIADRAREGMPLFGTCAGAILLSDTHLKLMDISVERNAYGAQAASFTAQLDIEEIGSVEAAFIRAPRIVRVGNACTVLAKYNGDPVAVRQGSMLASTFHTELSSEVRLHQYFVDFVSRGK